MFEVVVVVLLLLLSSFNVFVPTSGHPFLVLDKSFVKIHLIVSSSSLYKVYASRGYILMFHITNAHCLIMLLKDTLFFITHFS